MADKTVAGTATPARRPADPTPEPKRRRRLRRVLIGCVVALLVVVGLLAAGVYAVSEHLAGEVRRVPHVFAPLQNAKRPAPPTGAAAHGMTFLLVGSDSRAAPTTGTQARAGLTYGGQRSDVIMLVWLAADRSSAAVVSIPRDSWVPVPGHGMAKINAAYSWGGPTLLVRTVERLTRVRVDHFAAIDFTGFQAMTNALGGVDVRVAAPTSSRGVSFHAGLNHLDGAQALVYVRQRYGLPRGDLDRVQRQQNLLRALMVKARAGGMLTNPVRTYHLLSAVARSVSVDDTMSNGELRSLALGLRHLGAGSTTFLTAPVAGFGFEGTQSVVHLDGSRAARLWAAINTGHVTQYQRAYGEALPAAPR